VQDSRERKAFCNPSYAAGRKEVRAGGFKSLYNKKYGTPIRDTVFLAQPVAEERPALPEEGGFVPQDPFAGLDDNETN
jgi:hypothetical protein